jgi:23S rRNA pseudouridine1911/1915/1917 synthase
MAKRPRDPNSKIFHVTAELSDQTLASALKTWEPELSWSKIRKLIDARHVQINGNLCLDSGRRLKPEEVVKLFVHPLAPPPRAENVDIVYMDQHLVIVDKPSGITSVRHASEVSPKSKNRKTQATLEDLMPQILERRGGKIAQDVERKPVRPTRGRKPLAPRPSRIKVFPVHRLDRDTSGLIMFALSTAVEQQLIEMFRDHTIQRTYRAVARGNVKATTIETHLARDRGDGLRGSVDEKTPDVQRAVTHVRPVKGLGKYTLVECRLETGRTHQIRIHLSEKGHMLCGEKMYCRTRSGQIVTDNSGAPRLALHAAKLEFLHPVLGKKISVDSELPRDLKQFVERLEQERRTPRK